MLLYHAADLLWASRLAAAARSAGVPAIAINDAASAQRAAARTAGGAFLALVDLASPHALAIIRSLRDAFEQAGCAGRVRLIAFGPHVDPAALHAARDAGADDAIPRGALAKRLHALLAETASRDPQA